MEPAPLMRFLHYTMTVLFFLLMITHVGSLTSQCGRFDTKYQMFSSENRVLKNYVQKQKTVFNHVLCGRDCSMDEDCKSFNFYKCKKLCELNNATRAEHPQDFIEDQGSVYFDADEDTPIHALGDNSIIHYTSCKKLKEAGFHTSDTYTIYPDGLDDGLNVYCDMETDGGGWIVFSGEFWLGNDYLVKLTSKGTWSLHVDLEKWNGEKAFARYTNFKIVGDKYSLQYSEYDGSSTATDDLGTHNNQPFTTKDNDNDNNPNSGYCADRFKGAWRYNNCLDSNLNGKYYHYSQDPDDNTGTLWQHFNSKKSLKSCSMKIRE